MITLDPVFSPKKNKTRLFWNISSSVGGNSRSQAIDIKLVQWYFISSNAFFSFSFGPGDVTGIWNSKSQDALKAFESTFKAIDVQDGIIDPLKPGSIDVGRDDSSGKVYKLSILADDYIIAKILSKGLDLTTLEDIDQTNSILLNMGNDEGMPGDLSFALNTLAATVGGNSGDSSS